MSDARWAFWKKATTPAELDSALPAKHTLGSMLSWRARLFLWVRRGTQWREVISLVVIMTITLLLWNTWAAYPLRLLVVFFHELNQGLMALLTGGVITEIQISPEMQGTSTIEGGHTLSILLAAYWGSLLWGIGLYLIALKWSRATWVNTAMGVLIYTVAVMYIPKFSMGFAMAALAGAGLVFAAVKLPVFVNRLLLKVIALTNCLYALFDVRSADGAGSSLQRDADRLAELTGVPAALWGLLWIGIALPAVCLLLLVVTRRGNAKPAKRA